MRGEEPGSDYSDVNPFPIGPNGGHQAFGFPPFGHKRKTVKTKKPLKKKSFKMGTRRHKGNNKGKFVIRNTFVICLIHVGGCQHYHTSTNDLLSIIIS